MAKKTIDNTINKAIPSSTIKTNMGFVEISADAILASTRPNVHSTLIGKWYYSILLQRKYSQTKGKTIFYYGQNNLK